MALAGDAAKRTVAVDQVERVVGEIHQLIARHQIARGPVTEPNQQRRGHQHQRRIPGGWRLQRRVLDRQHQPELAIVEGDERYGKRQPVQPGEVAGQDEPDLVDDDNEAADARHRLRREQAERHHQLGDVIAQHFQPVDRLRQMVEVPAQRVGHGLGLVVVVQARQIAPAGVVADLDQSGSELDAEQQPAQQPQHRRWRCCAGWAEEDRHEAGFEQQRLPAEGVERLADVDDRQIQRPQGQPGQHGQPGGPGLRRPEQQQCGDRHAGPCDYLQKPVRVVRMKQAGCFAKGCQAQETRCG